MNNFHHATLDSDLSFDEHIIGVVRACNYHLCSLRHIRHLIDREAANAIACSIVGSRLDYCNSILFGITDKNICRLQRFQNSLARVVCGASYLSSTTALRRSLHWLPIKQRIDHKVATLTFKVWLRHQPVYLSEFIIDYKVATLTFKVWLRHQLVYLSELIIDYTPSRILRSAGKD